MNDTTAALSRRHALGVCRSRSSSSSALLLLLLLLASGEKGNVHIPRKKTPQYIHIVAPLHGPSQYHATSGLWSDSFHGSDANAKHVGFQTGNLQ